MLKRPLPRHTSHEAPPAVRILAVWSARTPRG